MNSELIGIAICDDDVKLLDIMSRQLARYNEENGISANIQIFSSTKDLKQILEQRGYFDLFILDIRMTNDEINGVRMGQLIRNEFGLADPLIIYISAYRDHAEELLPLHVFNFIDKSIRGESLRIYADAIRNIYRIKQRQLDDDAIMYQYGQGQDAGSVKLYAIVYIESKKHKNRLIYRKPGGDYGEILYSATLKGTEDSLLQYDFVSPHQSFIVNMRRIHKYEKNTLLMENGALINITYTKRKQAKARLNRFFDIYELSRVLPNDDPNKELLLLSKIMEKSERLSRDAEQIAEILNRPPK